MSKNNEVKIPDIGGAVVDVIELLVQPGDEIEIDTPLITLESDKASMEIPSSVKGVVESINLKVGDKASEGDIILTIKKSLSSTAIEKSEDMSVPLPEKEDKKPIKDEPIHISKQVDICIPDIGGASNVDVIEILVKPGYEVTKEQPLITLEGDKATMDIPAPISGTVEKIIIQVGDKVSQGDLILVMSSQDKASNVSSHENEETTPVHSVSEVKQEAQSSDSAPASSDYGSGRDVYAGPAVRRLAHDLGVDLKLVKGSGRKSRVTKEDIQEFVKKKLNEKSSLGFDFYAAPTIDFSKFGNIESKPLNKIKRITGEHTHRSWVSIPHVTQFDEADVTDLESFRKSESSQSKAVDYKLTLLSFVCKVVAKALAKYPQFNASLDANGENLIYKKYTNIGIAVETPNGLVVPVIKAVDDLSVIDIAREMTKLSLKAREKGLTPMDMSGGCFTISSLGGIGGTAFTPIVNAPEVAILGLSRSSFKPIYINGEFQPRLMLPMSLSYDHRVIDGAEAARFTRYLADCLSDIRRVLL